MNSAMSLRTTIAYLLMVLKKVTEVQLLWSIETMLSVFDCQIQPASSELNSLLLAIDVVRRSKENNFVIFSDSVSSLQSINGFNLDSDLVKKILRAILSQNGKNIVLRWIPSHMGIPGNEKADAAAKSSLYLWLRWSFLPPTLYHCITKLIFDEWQEIWSCCAGNKLHAIKPSVGVYKRKTWLLRRDSVLLNRLRIGHTRLTHSFLLSGDDIPECGTCQCPLTVIVSETHPNEVCWF